MSRQIVTQNVVVWMILDLELTGVVIYLKTQGGVTKSDPRQWHCTGLPFP